MKAELLDSTPPGSVATCQKAGLIQKASCMQWFKHFVKLSRKDPVILTLDGYYSHLRNIEGIDCAREMHIVCLPLHSTHKLQPMGVSFMQPLKTYYAQEIEIWLKNHPKELLNTIKLLDWLGKLT